MESKEEIELILNMRIRKGVKEYFVKWLNEDKADSSWNTESEITDSKLIELFWVILLLNLYFFQLSF